MTKEAVFTMKLEPELRDDFMAEAQALDRPASQVVRDLMREFVRRQRERRDYETFMRQKVAAGRKDIRAGRSQSHSQVEADFAKRRSQLLRSSRKSTS